MRFHIQDDTLTVIFQGMEQVWAIKRKLVITKRQIAKMQWHDMLQLGRRELGWRIGSTGLPGVLAAGRFTGSQGKSFVYLQRPQGYSKTQVSIPHVLEIDTRDFPYKKLLFTVDDTEMANQIIAWWSSNV